MNLWIQLMMVYFLVLYFFTYIINLICLPIIWLCYLICFHLAWSNWLGGDSIMFIIRKTYSRLVSWCQISWISPSKFLYILSQLLLWWIYTELNMWLNATVIVMTHFLRRHCNSLQEQASSAPVKSFIGPPITWFCYLISCF